jgi:fructose transport system ATP-binding protein
MNNNQKNIILKTEGLTKHYGGVKALQDANFSLAEGEHVAIVGDNGAGKSTFIRQVTGVEIPTSGDVYFDGNLVNFKTPADAKEAGIETVYQNLALADDLDVPSNIFLGKEETYFNFGPFSFLNEKKMHKKSIDVLAKTGIKIPDLKIAMSNMSGGQRQCVAVSRSAGFASKLIIMDEPTAALGVQETAQVENIIKSIKKQGIPLIVISHNLRQVFDLVDKIWVLRQGKIVGCVETSKSNTNEIVSLITGVKQEVAGEASFI